MIPSRRRFIQIAPLTGAALWSARRAQAEMVSESDAQATALGYVGDASRADRARFKQYAPGQHCAVCALFQGKAGSATGPCPLFPGREVAAKGWCSAFARRP